MKTDDLIRILAEDSVAEAAPARRLWPLFLPAVAVSLAAVLLTLGPRPDLPGALVTFVPAMRHVLSVALFGLAGGGAGAAVYALHCTEVSPLFYVTWYGLAILVVTAVSALLGPRILRW